MTIYLGVDPGSVKSAWALLESRGVSPAPISITLLEKGMVESRLFEAQCLIDDDLPAAPDVFCIETIAGYAYAATSQRGGGQAVVKALLETAKVEEMIRGLCRSRGEVVDVTAQQWRKAVCGRGNATSALITAALRRHVHGITARNTNKHTRDAIGAAVASCWARGGRA